MILWSITVHYSGGSRISCGEDVNSRCCLFSVTGDQIKGSWFRYPPESRKFFSTGNMGLLRGLSFKKQTRKSALRGPTATAFADYCPCIDVHITFMFMLFFFQKLTETDKNTRKRVTVTMAKGLLKSDFAPPIFKLKTRASNHFTTRGQANTC